jgi:hypothetical protein
VVVTMPDDQAREKHFRRARVDGAMREPEPGPLRA